MRLPSDVGIFVKIASPTASIVWELDLPVLNIFVLNSYLQGSENAFDNPTGASPPPNPAAFPPVVRLCHQPPWHSSLPSSHSPCQVTLTWTNISLFITSHQSMKNLSTAVLAHFLKETFFSGGFGVSNHSQRRLQVVQCILFTKHFLFLMYLLVHQSKPAFEEIY